MNIKGFANDRCKGDINGVEEARVYRARMKSEFQIFARIHAKIVKYHATVLFLRTRELGTFVGIKTFDRNEGV